jgi:ketosteroid isomerase-like protein
MSDNVTKLQEMYAAFGRGEIDALLANVTDDVSWGIDTEVTDVPWYRLRSGREGVADFFAVLGQEVEFQKFEPSGFVAGGDAVFVNIDYVYKFRKNGKAASSKAVHRFELRDGKVTSFRAFEDTAAIRAAWNT